MTTNPFINAAAGLAYIVLVASVLFYGLPGTHIENTVLIPIAMLSLFVFSAAIMGYIFLYEPIQLFLEDKKKESVNLFIQTLLSFAVIAALFVSIGLYIRL